uniref:Eukaryotic translation initiation factor 2 subunit 1 n=1 Tax=Mesocestoides corti TaxID=53468 RepID=A0A5K3ETF0_MESCO
MPLTCRFYENEFPAENDVVVAVVTSIADGGSYVVLPEYDNAAGMILHSELSRRRIRSINKHIRVGRSDIVLVIRVDPEKRYIDLSKRLVPIEDVCVCQERYAKAKAVNQIVRHAAEKLGYTEKEQLKDLCAKTVWFFDKKYANSGGSYEAFRRAVQNPSVLDACDIDEKTKEMLLQDIRHRLMPQAVKLRADFEVSCFAYEGIDAVRRALHAGLALSTEDLPIKINLIAPPLYVLTTQTLEWNKGLARLEQVLETIKASIEEQEGSFKLQQKPRVVSDTEEADFQRHLEELEDANKEVSGDDDDDEDVDEDDDSGSEGSSR